MIPEPKKNEGYALAAVMMFFSIAVIIGTAGFSIAMQDDRKIFEEAREIHAFWAAESGIQHLRAMTQKTTDEMGTGGLPKAGDILSWTNDMGHITSVTIQEMSGGFIAGYSMPTYSFTAVGTAQDIARTIEQKAKHSSYGFYGVVLANDNVFFTGADTISGNMHVNGYIKMSSSWGLPTFWGSSYSTEASLQIDWQKYVYPDGTKTVSARGSQTEVFKEGVYFNREPIDFSTKYVSNTIDYFEDVSKTDSKGLYLDGDYRVNFKQNGQIVCTKGYLKNDYLTVNQTTVDRGKWKKNGEKITTTTSDKNLIYVTGDCYISGVLDGDVTIVTADDAIIDYKGVNYESAPKNNKPVMDWTESELAELDDTLGIIAADDIVTYAPDTLQIHGVLLALAGGVYPINRNKDLRTKGEKPKLTVFGTVAEKVMEYTESSMSTGFGVDWHADARFKGITPPHFPLLDYKYEEWKML